jgi:hypothetical protein
MKNHSLDELMEWWIAAVPLKRYIGLVGAGVVVEREEEGKEIAEFNAYRI